MPKKALPVPFHRMNPIITKSDIGKINDLTKMPRTAIIKRGDISLEFFKSSVESARKYNEKNNGTVLDYYVAVAGRSKNNDQIIRSPFGKRSIYYKESLGATYKVIMKFIKELKKRYEGFKEAFLDVIFIIDKSRAEQEFNARKIRSEKQRQGRIKAKRERELIAREEKERAIRHKRALNKLLREKGLLKPAHKRVRK